MLSNVCPSFPLRIARVHEVCGAASLGFAMAVSGGLSSNVLWIRETWRPDILNPVALTTFLDPSRILLALTRDQTESLAVAEQALMDGSIELAVIEITRPLDLREGRRLQLASRAGNTTGLCLIPEGMGSNAAETRWHCAPVFDASSPSSDSTLMHWEITKNKSGTLGIWHVRWDATTRRLCVVPPVGKRPGSQDVPN